jgi:hypothetical protein
VRPHVSLFDGQLDWVAANLSGVADPTGTLAEAVTGFAAELAPEIPVILMIAGPPLTTQTVGAFYDAEICPSDFSTVYAQTEAWLGAALDAIPSDQFAGFGLALFDGAHFDLREPYEHYDFFALNRAGETGYNHPVVNIYRAQSLR